MWLGTAEGGCLEDLKNAAPPAQFTPGIVSRGFDYLLGLLGQGTVYILCLVTVNTETLMSVVCMKYCL